MELALNVLDVITSDPAWRYFSWISRIVSGRVRFRQVVAASEKFFARGELLAPVVGFVQAVLLYHRAESAVEQQDAVFEFVSYVAVFCHVVWYFIGV